eukprot:XP_020404449.1 classical arabinogalactan protein 4-like [Zea mays]
MTDWFMSVAPPDVVPSAPHAVSFRVFLSAARCSLPSPPPTHVPACACPPPPTRRRRPPAAPVSTRRRRRRVPAAARACLPAADANAAAARPCLPPPTSPVPSAATVRGFQTPPATVAAPGDGSGQDDASHSWVNNLFNTHSPAGGGGYSNHPGDGYD